MRTRENVILLKDLLERGIHIEQAFDFQTSVFFKTYEDMRQSVQRIVQDNRNLKCEMQGTKEPQEIGISNVISVIGRRGTGKSSAMLSFREALDGYRKSERYREYEGIQFSEKAQMGKVCFFSLDYIDASVLEESEDVFILVLANMLNYLEKTRKQGDENHETRDLMHHFEVLHNDFLTVKESTQYKNETYSSLETLFNIAGSQRVKRQFYKLVEEFLNYIRRKMNIATQELYLVISIDDLDMAHYNAQNKPTSCVNNKSYEIINSIYKYLSVPGVIVLTAYNQVNLMLQSENFFINSDTTDYHTQDDRIIQRKTSARLSNQFIDKVFAPAYRTYMPSWKKSDYQKDHFKVDVLSGFEGKRNIFDKYCGSDKCLTIKKLMLILYREKLGVRYDCEGTKLHFLEPDSLRRLSDAVMLFEDERFPLTEMVAEEDLQEYRRTIARKIKGDLYFHFVQEKLYLPEEKELYNELMELRIDRRSEEIVRQVSIITKPLGKAARKRERNYRIRLEKASYSMNDYKETIVYAQDILNRVNDNSNVKYSFAELVHSIYHMTREKSGYTRELVACILHSYSIYLSELYEEYHKLKKEISENVFRQCFDGYRSQDSHDWERTEKIKEIHGIFSGMIGDSICGHWCEYYFPEVYTAVTGGGAGYQDSEKVILGYCSLEQLRYSVYTLDEPEAMGMAVREIVFMSMFCVNVLDWENLKLEVYVGEKQFELQISLEESLDIELTAFVKYAFLYPEFLNKLEKLLSDSVESARYSKTREQLERSCFFEKMQAAIKSVFDELWHQFWEWDCHFGNMILPIHNCDCAYNLLKHMFRESAKGETTVKIVDGEDFHRELDRMNGRFLTHLREIDSYYDIETDEEKLSLIYSECPFLKQLTKTVFDDEKASKVIGQLIRNIIVQLSNERRIMGSADSWQEGSGNQ